MTLAWVSLSLPSRAAWTSPRPRRVRRALPTSLCPRYTLLSSSSSSLQAAEQYNSSPPIDPPGPYRGVFHETLVFPTHRELLALAYGESVSSAPFAIPTHDGPIYRFRVSVYPRGGGHAGSADPRGWGRKRGPERVGVYLQFLPDATDDTVDASFVFTLRGRQDPKPFDVEWRAGMRFVSLERSRLAQGRANDFGAHLLSTTMLRDLLGGADDDHDGTTSPSLHIRVTVSLHATTVPAAGVGDSRAWAPTRLLDDIRKIDSAPPSTNNIATTTTNERVRVGTIVVPVLQKLAQRPRMFQQGAYPGVEYRILRIIDPHTNRDLFYSQPGADYELKPVYPLVRQLERPWPVRVNERDIPKLLTPTMYNTVSAVGSLLTALTGLLVAFALSQAVSLFVIPSLSMAPTLAKGDVVLVDKLTPRFWGPRTNIPVGDVVFFHPPEPLQDMVIRSTGRRLAPRDLFVKRVAAGPGDVLTVDPSGSVRVNGATPAVARETCEAEPLRLIEAYLKKASPDNPDGANVRIGPGQVAVLGDCASVSIDSRVWGPLPQNDIVGRPVVRLWPPSRWGPVPGLLHAPDAL